MHWMLTTLLIFSLACKKDEKKDKRSSDGTAQIANDHPQAVAADEASLPPCTKENNNALIFVQSDKNFRLCVDEAWQIIDVSGEKGKDGADGAGAEFVGKGIELFKKYRASVYRLELSCKRDNSRKIDVDGSEVQCVDGSLGLQPTSESSGSGFLCGEKTICTNGHVAICHPCYDLVEISGVKVADDVNSVNPDIKVGGVSKPFFKLTDPKKIKKHPS